MVTLTSAVDAADAVVHSVITGEYKHALKIKPGLRSGYMNSMKGFALVGAPLAAISASTAPRGKVVNRTASSIAAQIIPAFIGGATGGPIGSAVADLMFGGTLEKGINKVLDQATGYGKRTTRLNMGGHYQDTQQAYTMRQRAVQEINTSLLSARQHLGKEGVLMHT